MVTDPYYYLDIGFLANKITEDIDKEVKESIILTIL
jgi:hypothetical protein